LPHETYLVNRFAEAGVTDVLINTHTQPGNTVLGEHFRVIYGEGLLRQKIGGITYQLSPGSFFQVNTKQTKVLYDLALELGGFNGNESVIDAHAGVGGVALYAANRVKKVYGVEIAVQSVVDANKNAVLNGIENVDFICGEAEKIIPDLLAKHAIDAVFLDPPRKGCGVELLEGIIKAGVGKVIYISCEPATLARDVKLLYENGYGLKRVCPVDLFPQTGKVEAVCLLEKSL
jgi:23S rRNA (uracil1939-C5)-methyltransferase